MKYNMVQHEKLRKTFLKGRDILFEYHTTSNVRMKFALIYRRKVRFDSEYKIESGT